MADASARTTRLELADATLREWSAVVLDASPDGVVLDRSAFYPGGGGQPPDQGVLLWSGGQSRVVGVRRGDDLLQLAEVAVHHAREVAADRRIDVRVLPREAAFAIPDIIRTATDLLPPDLTDVRIVDIVGLDTQADGGTHVASTRQIGGIEVVKVENKGKANRRLRVRLRD